MGIYIFNAYFSVWMKLISGFIRVTFKDKLNVLFASRCSKAILMYHLNILILIEHLGIHLKKINLYFIALLHILIDLIHFLTSLFNSFDNYEIILRTQN